jgi:hypothetical protein
MRLRVEVKVDEPLLRAVTVYSSLLQTTESFVVQYERLPIYCFSCGLLGHSTLACTNPVDRDEQGELPYSARRLSVDDNVRKFGNNSATSAHSGTAQQGTHGGANTYNSSSVAAGSREAEDSSPSRGGRGAARGRGRSGRGHGRGRAEEAGRESVPVKTKPSTAGKKRKTGKVQNEVLLLEAPPAVGLLAMVPVVAGVSATQKDVHNSDSNKKQRTTPTRSADPVEAAMQLRPTQ